AGVAVIAIVTIVAIVAAPVGVVRRAVARPVTGLPRRDEARTRVIEIVLFVDVVHVVDLVVRLVNVVLGLRIVVVAVDVTVRVAPAVADQTQLLPDAAPAADFILHGEYFFGLVLDAVTLGGGKRVHDLAHAVAVAEPAHDDFVLKAVGLGEPHADRVRVRAYAGGEVLVVLVILVVFLVVEVIFLIVFEVVLVILVFEVVLFLVLQVVVYRGVILG